MLLWLHGTEENDESPHQDATQMLINSTLLSVRIQFSIYRVALKVKTFSQSCDLRKAEQTF